MRKHASVERSRVDAQKEGAERSKADKPRGPGSSSKLYPSNMPEKKAMTSAASARKQTSDPRSKMSSAVSHDDSQNAGDGPVAEVASFSHASAKISHRLSYQPREKTEPADVVVYGNKSFDWKANRKMVSLAGPTI